MIFNSFAFFIFLIITLLACYLAPSRLRKYVLILASAFFYIYGQAAFIILIIFVILVNFLLSAKIEQAPTKKKKKPYLYISMFLNIGVLVFFKYFNFIIQNISLLSGLFKVKNPIPFLDIALPLGLSFYIFQSIGYMLDVYRGNQKAEKNLADFTLFILFFPKLLVGPIERTKNFLPQIKMEITFRREDIILGLKLITWGLFRKLVVADRIAIYTDAIFRNYTYHSGITIFVAILLYAIQLYADFSGYTDIAIGIARLFGFKLMQNFNRPFLAQNVSEFWRRWHISLSSWVNIYIYNPIALNRRDWGNFGVSYALLISFSIIGIWHGATWNFVIVGLLQAVALIYETFTIKLRRKVANVIPSLIYEKLSIILTFLFFSFCLVFFRTPSFNDAIAIIYRVFTAHGGFFYDSFSTIIFMAAGILILILCDIQDEFKIFKIRFFKNEHWFVQQFAYILLLIIILVLGVFDGGQFIYFQF